MNLDVSSLKAMVQVRMGIRVSAQTLIHGGRALRPDEKLSDVLSNGATIFVLIDTGAFPETLGPFAVRPSPFKGDDFYMPSWGGKVRSTAEGGMYLVSEAAVTRHGVTADKSLPFPLVGQLSPLHPVTVPDTDKPALHIPVGAASFAWSYPCGAWEKLSAADAADGESATNAITFLSTGGFVYFDTDLNILGSNTIVPSDTDGGMQFGAPRRWYPEWTEALMRQGGGQYGRFHRITLAGLRHSGARYFAWLPPTEVMLDKDGVPLARQLEQHHGAFAYLFHDDPLAAGGAAALDRYFPLVLPVKGVKDMRQVVGDEVDGGLLSRLYFEADGNTSKALAAYYGTHAPKPAQPKGVKKDPPPRKLSEEGRSPSGGGGGEVPMWMLHQQTTSTSAISANDEAELSPEEVAQRVHKTTALITGAVRTLKGLEADAARKRSAKNLTALASAIPSAEAPRMRSLPGLSEIPERAKKLVQEVCTSEETYVHNISAMVTVYMRNAMLDSMINPQEAQTIFGNAERILECNTSLLERLKEQGEPVMVLSRVFLDVGHFFEAYLTYCYGYEAGLQVLAARRGQSKQVNAWFEKQRKHDRCGNQPVESFLIMPVQRLLKYPLFFRELLELVPQLHPARDMLEKAARVIGELSTSVNEQMNHPSLSLTPLLEALAPYRDLVALLPAPHRQLLCEFTCRLAEKDRDAPDAATAFGSKAKVLPVMGYVLSDLLLLCKADGKSHTVSMDSSGLHHTERIGPKPMLLEDIEEVQVLRVTMPAAPDSAARRGSVRNVMVQEVLAELRVLASGETWLMSLADEGELLNLQEALRQACQAKIERLTNAHGSADSIGENDADATTQALVQAMQRRLRAKRMHKRHTESRHHFVVPHVPHPSLHMPNVRRKSSVDATSAAGGEWGYGTPGGGDPPASARLGRTSGSTFDGAASGSSHAAAAAAASKEVGVLVRVIEGDTAQDTVDPGFANFFVCTDDRHVLEAEGHSSTDNTTGPVWRKRSSVSKMLPGLTRQLSLGRKRKSLVAKAEAVNPSGVQVDLPGSDAGASPRYGYKVYPMAVPQISAVRGWVAFDRKGVEAGHGGLPIGRDAIRRDCAPWVLNFLRQLQKGKGAQLGGAAVFGGSLAALLKRPDAREDGTPAVVRLLCARLLANDHEELNEVGIFRVPGDAAEVAEVATAINRGEEAEKCVRNCSGAHTVAALLKKFFRELTSPLCGFENYDELVGLAAHLGEASAGGSAPDLAPLKSILVRLPAGQLAILGRLMAFLRVVVGVEVNRMSVANLAAVWGPNLLRPQVETAAQLSDVVHVVALTGIMIQHADALFDTPLPLGQIA